MYEFYEKSQRNIIVSWKLVVYTYKLQLVLIFERWHIFSILAWAIYIKDKFESKMLRILQVQRDN